MEIETFFNLWNIYNLRIIHFLKTNLKPSSHLHSFSASFLIPSNHFRLNPSARMVSVGPFLHRILIFNDNYMKQEQLQPFQQFYDELGHTQAQLKWSHNSHSLLLTGASDFAVLAKLKNVILSLRKDWGADRLKGIRTQGDADIDKRLLLAQSELQGLLKRRINYSVKDSNGERVLDYSTLLNEKENQVVELEKKIQNLEDRLRRAADREQQLEEHVVRLTEELKRKEDLIILKHDSAVAEVASCTAFRDAINRLKRNVDLNRFKLGQAERLIFQGVTFPDVGNFDIKSDVFSQGTLASRSRVFQQQTEGQKYKTRLVQFFREFERLANQSQGVTDFEVERILQGFLLNMSDSKLYQKVQFSIEQYRNNQELKRLRENFAVAAGIYVELITQIKRDNVAYTLPVGVDNIFELLKQEKVVAAQVASGAVFISQTTGSKTIQVPVQDARTKHLIHLLAYELKGLFMRYPKIQAEIDPRLAEFLQQEIIDAVDADQMEKLIQIVKFVPQIVKVENVYTQSTAKERKVEFHLRVLIKALLEELEKVRAKTGIVLQLDEGVLGMIRAEIMDAVSVDDILKVFRVNAKIVQVEKIVEKVVQRLVEVPKVITVEKVVEKIVEVEKIKEVERIVHVPVQKPLIVETQVQKLVPVESKIETIVEVPTIVERMVELQKEVAKVMEVQVIKEKIVQVEKPIEVQRVVNHIQTEYQEVQVIVQKLVPVEKIVEKIIEVPVFVEKIVERVVQVPKLVEVQRVVEKIVPIIEYRSAREVQNHVEVKYQVVDRIVEKLVPVIQWRERIKEVPQEVQVIKQVTNVVTEIKEVEVIREKIVIQEVIKEVPVVETRLVQVVREVIKEVDRFIEVPVIREVPVIKELIVEKPVISRVESVHIQEVVIKEPLIVKEPTIVQVEKFVNVYVEVPKAIKYIEEKIVEVPTTVDRIKEVRVIVEKIIEKMVEVPRVVQVEKIVEKVVVVPRVIEKVVEVPQFVQKIVEKEVIREVIRQVEKIVHVPVIQETIKQVEVIKNVYIEIEKPVDRVIQRAVEVPRIEQKVITREVLREVPINLIHEVPRDICVEKIVPQMLQSLKVVEVDRQIIVPYEIPVPVDRIVEKIVPREEIIERVIPVPQVIEKIVPLVQEVVQLQEVQKIVERILIEKSIVEIEKIVPYIQEIIKEVPTIVERLIPVESRVEQIITAQQIIEKVIEKTITIPQIYQVEKVREKLVEVPKLIEVERVIPQIIRVNQYIQKIVEKIIQVPTIIETMKEVVREQEKIVPISSQTTEIVEVERRVEKLVYAEKLKEVVRNVNYIEKVLQIIDRIEQVPVAVTTYEEKLIEVPVILEKIVERIIVMPQIVEVLKYVTEVCQVADAGVKVEAQVGAHEARFKQLSRSIELHLDAVLKDLRYLKSDQITRARIETIEKFLDELRRFILTPRIVKVVEERIVEKEVLVDHIVKMPVQDDKSLRMQLSLGILVQKLVGELKRLKVKTGANIQLDEDIRLIFFADLNAPVNLQGEMQARLKSYSSLIQRQFQGLGNWTLDHQLMLNSFLQERFLMAELIQNANFEIEQAKAVSEQRMEGLKRYRGDSNAYAGLLGQIGAIIAENRPVVEIVNVVQEFERLKASGRPEAQPTFPALDLTIDSERIDSLLRQKDAEIVMLRDSLVQSRQRTTEQSSAQQDGIIKVLKGEIDSLRKENSNLLSKSSQVGLVESYRQQIADLQGRNLQLQSQISRLTSDNYNQANELKLMLHNVSFKREPEATFQEVDIREERSRLQQSQSSQGRSLTGSQAQGRTGDIGGFTSSVYVAPKGGLETKLQTEQKGGAGESKLSQSGVKNVQTPPISGFENVSLVKSGIYTTQAGQYGSTYEPYQSQKREQGQQGQLGQQGLTSSRAEQVSQFGQTLYQSGVQKYQPDIKNFGVEQSGAAGQTQAGQAVTGQSGVRQTQTSGVYQPQSTMYQSGTAYQPQSGLYQSGTTYQASQGGAYQQGQSGIYQPAGTSTSTIRPGQQGSVISQGVQEGASSRLAGSQSSQLGAIRPGETLYSSRQDVSRGVTPATQSLYSEQGQQGQQARSGISGATGTLYGSQAQGTTTSAQSSIIHTPIESLKYRSPSPKGGKLTESILKEEQSLSKLSAQSPQVFKKEEGGRGEYKYYYRPEKKE